MTQQRNRTSPFPAAVLAAVLATITVACDGQAPTGEAEEKIRIEASAADPAHQVGADPAKGPGSSPSEDAPGMGNREGPLPLLQLRIRGGGIISAEAVPLVYVDGVRVDRTAGQGESIMDDLGPDNIDRIEVLKGPAAVKLYGEEAKDGVIQIYLKESNSGFRGALGGLIEEVGAGISKTGEKVSEAGEKIRKGKN